MTEKEKIDDAECTLFSDDFVRTARITYTDRTKKYFAVGKEDILDDDNLEIPITMTDFFYEADEAARKWIVAGPRVAGTDEAFEQASAPGDEGEEIREMSCDIFPKDFERYVIMKYSPETKKYFVTGREYDRDLVMYSEEIPITMADFFHEAEKEAWKWIEAGPRKGGG